MSEALLVESLLDPVIICPARLAQRVRNRFFITVSRRLDSVGLSPEATRRSDVGSNRRCLCIIRYHTREIGRNPLLVVFKEAEGSSEPDGAPSRPSC
jgi:hypothetical protein